MKYSVELPDLFTQVKTDSPLPHIMISGIAIDSRQVKPGDLFVALVGLSVDRHDYIDNAILKGAVAVVGTRESISQDIPYIQVTDDRKALAYLSAALYGYPGRKLKIVGVTGTDGKTSTTNLLFHLLRTAGINAGMISTVNAVIGDQEMDTGFHVTSPEAMDTQRYLANMVEAGLEMVVLETTSHGLAQKRVIIEDYDISIVTNITHEHLDYHGSFEQYRADKGKMFEGLSIPSEKHPSLNRLGILNRDDSSYEYLSGITKVKHISYGVHSAADVRAVGIQHSPSGLAFTIQSDEFSFPVKSSLIGQFNVSNILASVCAARIGLGIEVEAIQKGIETFAGVPGRMEVIDFGQPFTTAVDFAHTPNALRNILLAARKITSGRVIAVFGSAGLRDREKRRMMAETSLELADLTVLTAEDPRTESLEGILEEMAAGAKKMGGVEGKNFWRILDRGEAIAFGLTLAEDGDIVLALGKGHEQSMCFGETEYLWDDRTALRASLSKYLGIDGPEMPYLPTRET
ncbi:MAG: UDP-N-acetylmuramoyl-L-alanyl-D-glutamate--2,6-diaminopimelate ligase [Anaerolineales bacterium]|nr:UDP-N-acetylmuramoyl-L-alanyl-D-glutamate--2,6-diaminopimelate ligase [Anaerolineales bacterium]